MSNVDCGLGVVIRQPGCDWNVAKSSRNTQSFMSAACWQEVRGGSSRSAAARCSTGVLCIVLLLLHAQGDMVFVRCQNSNTVYIKCDIDIPSGKCKGKTVKVQKGGEEMAPRQVRHMHVV
jgi:hypothetical protein